MIDDFKLEHVDAETQPMIDEIKATMGRYKAIGLVALALPSGSARNIRRGDTSIVLNLAKFALEQAEWDYKVDSVEKLVAH